LYYFAYGSDMNQKQISTRCAKPRMIAVAKLPDYQLAFFGYSAVWDGAEETVVPAPGHDVWGVVYDLSPSDRDRLDNAQDARLDGSGSHFHYPAKVTGEDGKAYSILLFKKDKLGISQKPSQEYLDFIIQGAIERELPPAYVESLRELECRRAQFAVPRERRSARELVAGGDCSQCGDTQSSPASVIHISPASGERS
jgi:hypothetical protein